MSIDLKLNLLLQASQSASSSVGPVNFNLQEGGQVALVDGILSGQANKLYASAQTLAASATANLDIAGGVSDPLGNVLTFTAIKAIMVLASTDNVNDVKIGGAGSNAFVGPFGSATDSVAVRPGGSLLMFAPATGWPVTAGTGDLLKVLNAGAGSAVTFKVIIFGI
jgi:hypothetical protein